MLDFWNDFDHWDPDPIPEPDYDYWTMQDGTEILISDMSRTHLINAIKMLEQSDNPYVDGYIEVMKEELESRSTAQDAVNDFEKEN